MVLHHFSLAFPFVMRFSISTQVAFQLDRFDRSLCLIRGHMFIEIPESTRNKATYYYIIHTIFAHIAPLLQEHLDPLQKKYSTTLALCASHMVHGN